MKLRTRFMRTSGLLITACFLLLGSNSSPETGQTDTPGVTSISLIPNPNPTVPLAAVLNLTTEEFTRVISLHFDDSDRAWEVDFNE